MTKPAQVRDFVKNGSIGEAIEVLLKLAEETGDRSHLDATLLLSGQYQKSWKEQLLNLDKNPYLLNQSANACLQVLNQIENDLPIDLHSVKLPFNSFWGKIQEDVPLTIQEENLLRKSIALAKYELFGEIVTRIDKLTDIRFNESSQFKQWISNKRKFGREEVLKASFLKLSITGTAHIVHLLKDGSLEEFEIHTHINPNSANGDKSLNPNERFWGGKWTLLSGVLRMEIGQWELDVFANKNGLIHSGIEFAKEDNNVWLHSVFVIPYREFSRFNWEYH